MNLFINVRIGAIEIDTIEYVIVWVTTATNRYRMQKYYYQQTENMEHTKTKQKNKTREKQ